MQFDGAGIIASERREKLSASLTELERETGWRVRVLTFDGPSEFPGQAQLREAWEPNKRTVVLQFDPTSPNIMATPYMWVMSRMRIRAGT